MNCSPFCLGMRVYNSKLVSGWFPHFHLSRNYLPSPPRNYYCYTYIVALQQRVGFFWGDDDDDIRTHECVALIVNFRYEAWRHSTTITTHYIQNVNQFSVPFRLLLLACKNASIRKNPKMWWALNSEWEKKKGFTEKALSPFPQLQDVVIIVILIKEFFRTITLVS